MQARKRQLSVKLSQEQLDKMTGKTPSAPPAPSAVSATVSGSNVAPEEQPAKEVDSYQQVPAETEQAADAAKKEVLTTAVLLKYLELADGQLEGGLSESLIYTGTTAVTSLKTEVAFCNGNIQSCCTLSAGGNDRSLTCGDLRRCIIGMEMPMYIQNVEITGFRIISEFKVGENVLKKYVELF